LSTTRFQYSNDIIAAILAGGEGRRFRPYTDIIPKPMMPLGKEERPLLEYIVKWLKMHGIKSFVFLVGYKWRQIANYFDNGSRFGINIKYSLDDENYNNTGGALLKAWKNGLLNSKIVLIWYGDIIAPLDIDKLIEVHVKSNAHATLALADRYQVPVGVAEVDNEGNIVKMKEKPWIKINVTIGVLTLNPKVLDGVENELGTSFDIMGDLVPWLISKGYKVKAFIHRGPWYDVGSLERYHKLPEEELRNFLE
jgi:mannose-1-phosphate guanylyltransferase